MPLKNKTTSIVTRSRKDSIGTDYCRFTLYSSCWKTFLVFFLKFAPVTSLFLSSLMTDDEYLLLYLSIYFVF